MGRFIEKMEKNIPGGVLIFFPSYENMQFMLTTWDTAQVNFDRECFSEAKMATDFETTFKKYLKRI